MAKRKKIDIEKLTNKGSKKGKGGRPTLADQTTLTPEMERIAQLTYEGFTPEEIADELEVEVLRVLTFLQDNQVVQARIKHLFGDKRELWTKKRYALYEAALDTTTDLIKEKKVPWKVLYDLLKDFDSEHNFFHKMKETKKITTSTEDKEEPMQIGWKDDGDNSDGVSVGSIFKTKKTSQVLEHSKEDL